MNIIVDLHSGHNSSSHSFLAASRGHDKLVTMRSFSKDSKNEKDDLETSRSRQESIAAGEAKFKRL